MLESNNFFVSIWAKKKLANVGPNGDPIATPSICLYKDCLLLRIALKNGNPD